MLRAFDRAIARMQDLGADMHLRIDVGDLTSMRGTENLEGWTEYAHEDSFETNPELYRGTKIETLQDFVR